MFHIESPNIVPQSLKFPFRIWKVRTDPFSLDLALELREQAEMRVRYAVVRPSDGGLQLLFELEGKDWWTGIEDFREGILFLHGYEEAGLPLHQGLQAYSVAEKKLLWENDTASYSGMTTAGMVVEENGRSQLLQLHNGEKLAGLEAGDQLRKEMNAYEARRTEKLAAPLAEWAESPRHDTWKERIGISPFGPLSILEMDKWNVIAWHEGEPGNFALALALFAEDELVLDGWLEENMTGLHPDPYFVYDGAVITIREQKELVYVRLPHR
jgi:hypothetical protein